MQNRPLVRFALKLKLSAVKLMVPVLKSNELALSVSALAPAFMVMLPAPALTMLLAATVMPPVVSVMVTLPPPDWLTPVTVTGVATSLNDTLPLVVLVALKLVTLLLPFNVWPPTDDVVNNAPDIIPAPVSLIVPVALADTLPVVLMPPALSAMLRPESNVTTPEPLVTLAFKLISLLAPFAVKLTVPAPVADAVPLTVMLPVLVTAILPPPDCAMPVMDKVAAVLVNDTLPLVVFVALKLDTAFAPANV